MVGRLSRLSMEEVALKGWYGLGVFVLITLFGFVDRQVFILLAQPIKHDLALDDVQLGLLQGVGLALFGAAAGYPIGWLADRFDRRWVLAGCVALWSLSVAACGLVSSFGALFLASAVVGAGEAGLIPIVYSLIPSLVPNQQRQLANSIYTMATQVGFGLASALCAAAIVLAGSVRPQLPPVLSALADWRLAFLLVALPVPLFLALIATVRVAATPAAPTHLPVATIETAESLVAPITVTTHLRRHWQTMLSFYVGIGLAAFGFASIMNWVPAIAMRQFAVPVVEVGKLTGSITIVATIVGFVLGTAALRYLRPRFGVRLSIVALWTATLSAALTSFALLFISNATQMFVLQGVQYALIIGAFLVFPTAIQDLSPAPLRARLIALMGVIRLLLVAGSPVVVGAVSDQLSGRRDGLLVAAAGTATVSLGLGAALLWWCGRRYEIAVRAVTMGEAP